MRGRVHRNHDARLQLAVISAATHIFSYLEPVRRAYVPPRTSDWRTDADKLQRAEAKRARKAAKRNQQ